MKTYLVGGAVREKLLNHPVKDRDWVVVGADPQQLLDQGYISVGKDFPVFLHPETKEEYALARTERKTAPGYHGFCFHADSSVTLEQDLARRDLTINAMAMDDDGNIIDPYGGQEDIHNRLLRHVSPAFAEDPVRILRIARFAARYHHLGFTVADETVELIKQMVKAGEVDALVPERVWAETEKALGEEAPQVFFEVLRVGGALQRVYPEIDAMFGVPQPEQYHPEVDTGIHSLLVLQKAAELTEDKEVRFAALVHDLGKATTPEDVLPRHIGHEERGEVLVKQLCERLRCPKSYREIAMFAAKYHSNIHRSEELQPKTLLKLFNTLDAIRRPERIEKMINICIADARGRYGFEDVEYKSKEYIQTAHKTVLAVDTKAIARSGLEGKAIAEEIHRQRLRAIDGVKKDVK